MIVLGYPRLFELTPSCADPLAPNLTRRSKLNEGADVLNTVIQQTVGQHPGFGFADVRIRFAGHGVCSADPWINGPSVPAFVGPYHPNEAGYRDGYLDALNQATGRGAMAEHLALLRETGQPVPEPAQVSDVTVVDPLAA